MTLCKKLQVFLPYTMYITYSKYQSNYKRIITEKMRIDMGQILWIWIKVLSTYFGLPAWFQIQTVDSWAECKTMAFKRNLLQEKFRRLTLNQFRELMSEIRQGVPGKYEEYENPGCSSRIQKWTLSIEYHGTQNTLEQNFFLNISWPMVNSWIQMRH